MVNILVDDDVDIYQISQSNEEEQKRIANEINIDIIREKMKPLRKEREEKFKLEFQEVVVNDFGDEYHLSEEERREKNKYYEVFKEYSKLRHKFRKLPDFIRAMREALKCLDFVAQNNKVYDPDKFKKLFFRGKIWVGGLVLPEFKGKERKSISWEYLAEYIFSDEPAEDFLKEPDREIHTKEELDDMFERFFSDEEKEKILKSVNNEEIDYNYLYKPYDEDDDDRPIARELTKKEMKKTFKVMPELQNILKDYSDRNRKRYNNTASMSGFISNMLSEDIESITNYDAEYGYKELSKMPKFKGDLMNDKDYYKYMAELEEWEKTQVKVDYHGKLRTQEEIDEIELRHKLENHGWNLRNLFGNKEKLKRMKKAQKDEKRRTEKLKQKLIDIQKRRERRKIGDDYSIEEIEKEEKELKKNKKKLKKKGKKFLDKVSKETKKDEEYILNQTWDF